MPGLRSVRARIIATFSLFTLLLIGVCLISVFRLGDDQAGQVDVDAVEKASLTTAALRDIDSEFTLQLETMRAFPVTKDWSFADTFRESIARVQENVEEAKALQGDPADSQTLAALDDIARQTQEIEVQGEGAFLFTEVGADDQATTARSQVEDSIASLRPVVAEMISEQQHQMDLALPATASDGDLLLWALLGSAGLIFIVGVWAALTLTRSILRPLASLQASARAIASGNIATRPQIQGTPEFESLARDFDRMIVALLAKETAETGTTRAEERYRQLAERTADLVFRVDIRKGLTYANPIWEKVTGFTLEELASGPEIVGRLVHPDHWQSFIAVWKAMLSGNIPEGPLALKCLHKDGHTIWLTFNFLPAYDEDDHLVAIEGTARDTTMISHLMKEVRQREDQLHLFLNLSNAAATAIDFDEAATRALKAIFKLLPRTEAGFLMAHNRHRDLLEVRAVRGLDQKVMSKLVVKSGENLIGEAFKSGETQVYSSTKQLEAAGGLGPEGDELLKQSTEESNVPQSIVCAPLGISERPFGCLVLVTFSKESSFQALDLDLLQAAAAQVAPPLENLILRAETGLRPITDELTGLHNRAYFHQRLGEELERAKRYDHGLVLMIADIDNFESYSEAQEQAASDKILRLAADSIRSQMRRSDIACRYSDDQFAAIFMHADLNRAQVILGRIGKSMANKLKELNDPATADLSLSAGLASYPDDATSDDDLLRLADISLYSAKLGDSTAAQKI
jgi:diguanylate cyclase (GGDEF)-like protein/PAS domain S-box-containing protein